MAEDADQLGVKLWKRAEGLKEKRRYIFDVVVQELYNYFLPDLSDVNTEKTEGVAGWFQRLYDSAPIRAVSTCSVGIRNWVTPSTEPWLELSPPPTLFARNTGAPINPRMARLGNPSSMTGDNGPYDMAVRWCQNEAAGELQELSASNFYSIIQAFNRAAACSGTALMYCDEEDGELCFEQFKFGTFAIAENKKKLVDTVFRWFKLTCRQAEQRWGEENLPKGCREAFRKKKYDEEFNFLHVCMPTKDVPEKGWTMPGIEQKAFASIYISELEKKIVSEGGYEEMPYFALRFTRWGTDNQVYGCSPAYECLPDARQLNFVIQYQDAQVELKAYPRMIIPDSVTGEVELAPGGSTTVRADDMARGVVPKQWLDESDPKEVQLMIERKQQAIDKAFFVDIFNALGMLEDKQMTATEVAQRVGEKLDKFTGTFDQYRTELINPLVRRMMGLRLRGGRAQQPPQSMFVRNSADPKQPAELAVPKIEIKSRVTMALMEVKNTGTYKTIEQLAPLAEQKPEILDNFDLDEISRGIGRNNSMPERYIRPWEQMMALRQQRMKQEQEMRALEMAQGAAKAGKDLGKAPGPMKEAAMGQIEQFSAAAGGQ